ncbi:MAG: Beta-galactosidase C-terminal domain [Thermoproteota archaeon]
MLPSIKGLEATRRKGSGKEIIFLLNHRDETVELDLHPRVFRDLLSGEKLKDCENWGSRLQGNDIRLMMY